MFSINIIKNNSSYFKSKISLKINKYPLLSSSSSLFFSSYDGGKKYDSTLTWLIDKKNISRKVAEGIIDTMLATGNPSQIKSWSDSALKSLADAVIREQIELDLKAGKSKINININVPHENHSFVVTGIEGDNLYNIVKDGNNSELSSYLECACGGIAACSTCHVIVDSEFFRKLPEADEAELDMLDLAYGVKNTSRLGCQINLKKELEGMTLTIPNGVHNLW